MSHKASRYKRSDHEEAIKLLREAIDDDVTFPSEKCGERTGNHKFWYNLSEAHNNLHEFQNLFMFICMPKPEITTTRNSDKWRQVIAHLDKMIETDSDVTFKFNEEDVIRLGDDLISFATWSEVPFPDLGDGTDGSKWSKLHNFFVDLSNGRNPYE